MRTITRSPAPRGFTLIEVSLSLVILAVGVLAMIDAITAFRTKNAWSTHTASAMFMASELRELTASLPKHDALAGGLYFDPASGDLHGWSFELDEFDGNGDGAGDADDYLLFDDVDDFDGILFGTAPNPPGPVTRQFAGPIDAFGDVIPAQAWDNAAAAVVTCALSTDAIMGSTAPLEDRIHTLRGHRGQTEVARAQRALMQGSAIRDSQTLRTAMQSGQETSKIHLPHVLQMSGSSNIGLSIAKKKTNSDLRFSDQPHFDNSF